MLSSFGANKAMLSSFGANKASRRLGCVNNETLKLIDERRDGNVMKNRYAGSSFDNFLHEEGIENEVGARTAKRTFSHQLERQMKRSHKKKTHLRVALGSPTTAERLFNDHIGISLETMAKAANVVGCDLRIHLVAREQRRSRR